MTELERVQPERIDSMFLFLPVDETENHPNDDLTLVVRFTFPHLQEPVGIPASIAWRRQGWR